MIIISRRELLAALGSAAVAWPLAAGAQSPAKSYRVGYLTGGPEDGARRLYVPAFSRGMRDLGYIEGTNFSIDGRFADGKLALLPSLARELLSLHPDVLLVATTPAILAAKAATSTTPIAMVAVADPVGAGLVESLARDLAAISRASQISGRS